MIVIRARDVSAIKWSELHRGGILKWLYGDGVLLVPEELTFPEEEEEQEDFEQAFIRAMLEPVSEESEHPELM